MGKPVKKAGRWVGDAISKAGEAVGIGGPGASPPPLAPPPAAAQTPSGADPRLTAAILAERMRGGMGQGRKSTFRDATYQTPTPAEVQSTLAAVPPPPQPANVNAALEDIRRRMARVPGFRGGK